MKSSIGLFYQLTVTDKNGKIIRKTRLRRSKSFCIAFLRAIMIHMLIHANKTIKDVLGADETCPPYVNMLSSNGAVGDVARGIVLGTGTTTPDNLDYVMETLIAHGSGAGELNYAAQTDIEAQEIGANIDYQLIRSFQNLSGGTINVTEAGIYSHIQITKYAMIVHDVFTAVPVGDGQTITVTYTFRTTV